MLKKLKIPVLVGMSFYGISYAVVKTLGFSSSSFTVIAYLYIALGIILGLYYETERLGGAQNLLDRFVVVVEGEQMKLKKVFGGEVYRLKGEIEKMK